MFYVKLGVAVATAIVLSSPALSWGDMYMGDGTHNPNSEEPVPYHGPNYCPAGLQPVVLGGVICCGTVSSGYSPMQQQATQSDMYMRTDNKGHAFMSKPSY